MLLGAQQADFTSLYEKFFHSKLVGDYFGLLGKNRGA